MEYNWTKKLIKVTTKSIKQVKLSKRKPQSTIRSPLDNQGNNFNQQIWLDRVTSKKIKKDIKKLSKEIEIINNLDIKQPIKREKKEISTKIINGRKIDSKYILINLFY